MTDKAETDGRRRGILRNFGSIAIRGRAKADLYFKDCQGLHRVDRCSGTALRSQNAIQPGPRARASTGRLPPYFMFP
jgi:hypothetical protein